MSQRLIDQTYYEILEVSIDAPENEIHKAYQRAKQTYSPDSPALYTMFTPEEAQELARLIEEAYAVLSNHAARVEYDKRISGASGDQPIDPKIKSHPATMPINNSKPGKEKKPPKPSAPKGHKKTRISTYKVNDNFELEIEICESFNGEMLARIRDYKGVDIESLSGEIRVSKTYIRAIEGSDYESLPANVFVRGFVVQYAKALGLEEQRVANSFMNILKDARQ